MLGRSSRISGISIYVVLSYLPKDDNGFFCSWIQFLMKCKYVVASNMPFPYSWVSLHFSYSERWVIRRDWIVFEKLEAFLCRSLYIIRQIMKTLLERRSAPIPHEISAMVTELPENHPYRQIPRTCLVADLPLPSAHQLAILESKTIVVQGQSLPALLLLDETHTRHYFPRNRFRNPKTETAAQSASQTLCQYEDMEKCTRPVWA
jgi:hypothetical protein